jgi:hypothetical protein
MPSPRAGPDLANRIALKHLNKDGSATVRPGKIIIDASAMPDVETSLGPRPWQTTEGPKLYKRNGWYYIFAPSGGVKAVGRECFAAGRSKGPTKGAMSSTKAIPRSMVPIRARG